MHQSRKQKQNSKPYFIRRNAEQGQIIESDSSFCHVFSPPLKVCMLRKIRCRIQPQILDNNHNTISLSAIPSNKQLVVDSLDKSQNCIDRYISSMKHSQQYPSLIAINIGNNELQSEQRKVITDKYATNLCFAIDKAKLKNEVHFRRYENMS